MSWSRVSLAEISESVDYGHTASADTNIVGPKFLRITDIQDNHVDWASVPRCTCSESAARKYVLQEGDIVFARTGATTGKSYLLSHIPEEAVFASYLIRVRPRQTDVDPGYLARFFETQDYWGQVNQNSSGTAQGGVNASKLKKLSVPLPPLPEQRRIAAILDKADALRVKRREATAKLDQLLQSVFLEMFGDPVTNPKCRVVELASLCERVTDGTHQSPEWSEAGVPFLFQSNVKPGEISFETKRSISLEEYKALTARCPIEYGDVLYTIVGSYGNAAMVKTHEKFCFQRHIAHLKPKAHVLPEFLETMMNHPSVRRQADERVTGVAQKTLILKELKRLLVVEPSMEQQMQFRAVSQRISESRNAMVESAVKLSDGFSAIQNAAFSGAL